MISQPLGCWHHQIYQIFTQAYEYAISCLMLYCAEQKFVLDWFEHHKIDVNEHSYFAITEKNFII